MSKNAWQNLGLAVLTAVVLAGVVWLFASWPPEPPRIAAVAHPAVAATPTPRTVTLPHLTPSAEPGECKSVRQNLAAAPNHVSGPGPRVAIVGDSWVSGFALNRPTHGFAYRLARSEGWDATISGYPGSGYTYPSPCDPDSRVGDRVPRGQRLVMLFAGLNDALSPRSATAVDAGLERAIAATGDARVVVVGPPRVEARDPAALDSINSQLAITADTFGARYIPTLDWRGLTFTDGLHLTPQGHRVFAARLARML